MVLLGYSGLVVMLQLLNNVTVESLSEEGFIFSTDVTFFFSAVYALYKK